MAAFVIEIDGGNVPVHFVKMAEESARQWERIIIAPLPRQVGGAALDWDIRIRLRRNVTCSDHVLARSAPSAFRASAPGELYGLPYEGEVQICQRMLRAPDDPLWNRVILHEIGHALGIGTLWGKRGLLGQSGNYTGPAALSQYVGQYRGGKVPQWIPIETLGTGSIGVHWRESAFASELMSSELSDPRDPLSAISIASLADLGYKLDLSQAEPFDLPQGWLPERGWSVRVRSVRIK